MKTSGTLYEEVVNITYEYLGPAADRFIVRQIRSHLGKDPYQLRKQDLSSLIDWIRLAMMLLIEDKKLINKYVSDLHDLAKTSPQKAARA